MQTVLLDGFWHAYVEEHPMPHNGGPRVFFGALESQSRLAVFAFLGWLHGVQVLMYPSKSEGMFVPESLIFRSDSNGEDLEGYAGAG